AAVPAVSPTDRTNSRIPAANASPAALTDSDCVLVVLSPHLFGRPSVASRMIGGDPCGGGLALKSLTTASIDGGVGVLPPGFCEPMSMSILLWFPVTRETEDSVGHGASSENSEAPKYTCCSNWVTAPCGPVSAVRTVSYFTGSLGPGGLSA